MFAGHEEGDAALSHRLGEVAEGGGEIRVAHVVGVAARGDVQAHPAGAEDRDSRVHGLKHQAGAVFDGSAIGVGALVAAILQELVER